MAAFARSDATTLNINRGYLIATTITSQQTVFELISGPRIGQIWALD
jgi:hypothetical protein